jgi:hypothetical protein
VKPVFEPVFLVRAGMLGVRLRPQVSYVVRPAEFTANEVIHLARFPNGLAGLCSPRLPDTHSASWRCAVLGIYLLLHRGSDMPCVLAPLRRAYRGLAAEGDGSGRHTRIWEKRRPVLAVLCVALHIGSEAEYERNQGRQGSKGSVH